LDTVRIMAKNELMSKVWHSDQNITISKDNNKSTIDNYKLLSADLFFSLFWLQHGTHVDPKHNFHTAHFC